MWITEIEFPIAKKEEVEAVMSDINRRDQTFIWEIVYTKTSCKLKVKSGNRHIAWKRFCWLSNKVESLKDFSGYNVKQVD